MNIVKQENRDNARQILKEKGIKFESLNNDFHWKIGTMDFYPTTLRWNDNFKNVNGIGLKEMIKELDYTMKFKPGQVIPLTVQQMAKIFTKNQDKSLMEKLEMLHKEIYG